MTDEQVKQIKESALHKLSLLHDDTREQLESIDHRLLTYVLDVAKNEGDTHNVYEILSVRKFLRILERYDFNTEKVQRIFHAYELLKFSGLNGRQCYKLTPIQVFMLAATFGPMKNDGRRLVTEANYFIPRKFGKTTLAAFIQFLFFFFGDSNSQGYCAANSADQSKILYKLTYDLIHQLDPDEKRIRFTATEINWRVGQPREASVTALSAGGKTKDGLFAQVLTSDEYGSAPYVKDHSDMANLVNVVEGSMGPRREPLVVHTTTAGRVSEGPYEIKLRGIKDSLLADENDDWLFAMILEPDQWETDEESLQQPRVWRKVNPHIGITVQPDYYENEWKKMLKDPEKKREQITKLFNVWQCDRVQQWVNPDAIRALQTDTKIDDLSSENGWICFVGMDFSKGDDLNAQSYLCYNQDTGQFFADMDAWISETQLEKNTNGALYRTWVDKGWLHTSPGDTIDENLPLSRLKQIAERLDIWRIGYDAYDAQRFINAVKAWLFTEGFDPNQYVRPVRQTWATYNSPTQELDYMIKTKPALIHFSPNPMWAWEFGNAVLETDKMDNVKPIKNSPNSKVDNVQCLCSAIVLYDECNQSIE